jgi:hypothetical protein
MRTHHEAQTAQAILPALSMLVPVAGVLWARVISLRPACGRPEKAKAGNEEYRDWLSTTEGGGDGANS